MIVDFNEFHPYDRHTSTTSPLGTYLSQRQGTRLWHLAVAQDRIVTLQLSWWWKKLAEKSLSLGRTLCFLMFFLGFLRHKKNTPKRWSKNSWKKLQQTFRFLVIQALSIGFVSCRQLNFEIVEGFKGPEAQLIFPATCFQSFQPR